ncbi:hypothetical protein FRC10_004996, partial [Ceratobasidium sp. 414]
LGGQAALGLGFELEGTTISGGTVNPNLLIGAQPGPLHALSTPSIPPTPRQCCRAICRGGYHPAKDRAVEE